MDKELLMKFLDWYDPEASHRDIGLDGVVDAFIGEQQKAEHRQLEAASLAKGECPATGDRLTTYGNVQIPEGTLSCGVCDCFGYDPSEVGHITPK